MLGMSSDILPLIGDQCKRVSRTITSNDIFSVVKYIKHKYRYHYNINCFVYLYILFNKQKGNYYEPNMIYTMRPLCDPHATPCLCDP